MQPRNGSDTAPAACTGSAAPMAGQCIGCELDLCYTCKTAAHVGTTCDENAKIHEHAPLDDLAQQNGWTRCQNCRTYVQLSQGCNHIVCSCGHHFCFACAKAYTPAFKMASHPKPKKNCECPSGTNRTSSTKTSGEKTSPRKTSAELSCKESVPPSASSFNTSK